jgi:uncharacterized ferritin-like protein (DUF455 family)
MTTDWFYRFEQALIERDPADKVSQTRALFTNWCALDVDAQQNAIDQTSQSVIRQLPTAGRPDKPELLEGNQVPKRGMGTVEGRIALLHSLAHIEFNAINLALDAVYRFRRMPVDYFTDWLKVANDEAIHFTMVRERLQSLGADYGDMAAHAGLWQMALRTDHDVLVRMALVPRLLEARGLDVAPPMIKKLKDQQDHDSAVILQRIYTDEITHVEVGNRWFAHLCQERNLDGAVVFRDLLKGDTSAYLHSPYNDEARFKAGFTQAEMDIIRTMEQEYKQRQSRSS